MNLARSYASLRQRALAHWRVLAVVAVFASSAFVVPMLAPVWVADDWLYARSVEILLQEHRLQVLNLSVASSVAQVCWGAIFGAVFGVTPGVLRLSTVVLYALGGVATYGLCRELDVSRGPAALGAALFLFNPLGYVLGFSFMSDAPFAALLVTSMFFFARGLRREAPGLVLGGSAIAALAFLVRQQGLLIPLGVMTWLALTRRLRWDRSSGLTVLRVAGLPAAACAGYYVWLRFFHGVPAAQDNLFREIRAAGWSGMAETAANVAYVEAAYIGLFVLPVSAVAVVSARRIATTGSLRGWIAAAAWAGLVVIGLVALTGRDEYMPYVPQFLSWWGLGPNDIRGGRPPVIGETFQYWLTGLTAFSAIVFGWAVALRLSKPGSGTGGLPGLLVTVAAWQALGVIPPSLHYQIPLPAAVSAITLDRYLLPLLPLAVCLALWAVSGARPASGWPAWSAGWVLTAVFGAVAVAGTRDFLVFQDEVSRLADRLNRSGVPAVHMDAGAQWTGSHLYDDSPTIPAPQAGRSWWVNFFAPSTDARYMIATRRIAGYQTVQRARYSAWLSTRPGHLVVLRRDDIKAPAPPPR